VSDLPIQQGWYVIPALSLSEIGNIFGRSSGGRRSGLVTRALVDHIVTIGVDFSYPVRVY
jgi:hypothetical protein